MKPYRQDLYKIKITCLAAVLCLLSAIGLDSCQEEHVYFAEDVAPDIYTYNGFITECNRFCVQGKSDSMLFIASKVYGSPKVKENNFRLVSALYAAQASLDIYRYDLTEFYLSEIEKMDHTKTPTNLMGMWKGIQSTYMMKAEMNFSAALSYLFEAMTYYKEDKDWVNVCTALCNIGSIYSIRRDTTGLEYAKQAYRLSQEKDSYLFLQAMSLSMLSELYLLKGDISNANETALKSMEICDKNGYDVLYPMLYRITGEISFRIGDIRHAEELYKKGMKETRHNDPDYMLALSVSYGNLLTSTKRYGEAEAMLLEALETSDRTHNIKYGYQILEALSRLYETQGQTDKAFKYFKRFHASRDSVINVDKEKEFNQLLLKYEKASYENIIRKKEMNTAITISVMAIIFVAGLMSYLLYRRKDRSYRELVEHHRQYVQNKELMRRYSPAPARTDSDVEQDQDKQLFNRLEDLMQNGHIYRDNEISLEKVATMLGSNKTYISRIINRYTEKTFYGYVNMYRIEEATKILGNPQDDTPLKVLYEQIGYNSLQAFYRVFQKEVGCPPSKYREQIQKIDRSGKSHERPDNIS